MAGVGAPPLKLLSVLPEPGWDARAACSGMDTELWYQNRPPAMSVRRFRETLAATALATCGGCPVRNACGSWAVAVGESYGIWGGLLPEERAQARERLIRSRRSARSYVRKRDDRTRKVPARA